MSVYESMIQTQKNQENGEVIRGELVMYTKVLRNTASDLPAIIYRNKKIKQSNEMHNIIELDSSGRPISFSDYQCFIDSFTGKPIMVKLLAVA